jgi:hypothetical protein
MKTVEEIVKQLIEDWDCVPDGQEQERLQELINAVRDEENSFYCPYEDVDGDFEWSDDVP